MKQIFHLTAIGVSRYVEGSLQEAIRVAKQIDREYNRAFGVTITDDEGEVVATVEDGQVNRL